MKQAFSLLLALALLCSCLCACVQDDNRPYEPDTPAPEAHEGLFTSEHGSLRFNGDGKTVTIDFDEYLAGLTGLPAGESTADYVFLSGDLPPHGSVEVRYDTAHELKLTVGEQSVVLQIREPSEDGKTSYVSIGMVTPEHIPVMLSDGEGQVCFAFEKQAEKK
jgi:hypothetical protein